MATVYLNAAAVETRIKNLTQWTSAPVLTQTEIDDLVLMARTADEWGRWTYDAHYITTYTEASARIAAAEGWRWKAGKVASEFDAAVGGGTDFKRSQVYEMCLRMARKYSGGSGIGSIQVVR